jgi:hypothetical protein
MHQHQQQKLCPHPVWHTLRRLASTMVPHAAQCSRMFGLCRAVGAVTTFKMLELHQRLSCQRALLWILQLSGNPHTIGMAWLCTKKVLRWAFAVSKAMHMAALALTPPLWCA